MSTTEDHTRFRKRRVKAETSTTTKVEKPARPKRRRLASKITNSEVKEEAKVEKKTVRRKLATPLATPAVDPTNAADSSSQPARKKRTPAARPKNPKKLKRNVFGAEVTTAVRGRISRAQKQKMFIVERQRISPIEQKFTVLGSTGNLYTVTVAPKMKCNCPDGYLRSSYLCKHVIMVLMRVFRVPINHPVLRQPETEQGVIRNIIALGPGDASDFVDPEILQKVKKVINGEEKPEEVDLEDNKKRRPLDTSDCPICFESFSEEEISTITFCRTCGNNVHIVCFDNWKSYHPGSPTCVYCRSPWHLRPQPRHKLDRNSEGYVNLGKAFGLSNKRDASSYKMDKYGHYAYEYEDEDP